ncbi:MAG: hypothetical protein V5A55_09435 [Halovenus sp.]
MVSAIVLLFAGGFLLIGLGMTTLGGTGLRKWWTMRRMNPNAMVVESGLQEFEGRAHAIDGTVTAPFTGSQSLISVSRVQRYDYSDKGSNWDTVNKDVEAVPFEVEHSGSTVAVDPENARHLLTGEFRLDTGDTDDLPARVREYAERNLDTGPTVELGPIEVGENRYRFIEKRLDDGEDVYVLGPAEKGPSAVPADSDARLAIAPRERSWRQRLLGDPFVVSDTGEEQAVERQLKSASGVFLVGLAFVGAGLAVIILGS